MIIIPMAGLSSRFFRAGYQKPKYMLEAHGTPLFDHAILSFQKYFQTEHFIFVIRDVFGTASFVKSRAEHLGLKSWEVVVLEKETRGQAETVYLALKHTAHPDEALTIFNIDTFRPDFRFPDKDMDSGYLEVFEGTGDHWSFAEPASTGSTLVKRTTEKERISNLCSTGLYYFSDKADFIDAYEEYSQLPESEWPKGELYVAPLYNMMIKKGQPVHYNLIQASEVIFCGTPSEYEQFLASSQESGL